MKAGGQRHSLGSVLVRVFLWAACGLVYSTPAQVAAQFTRLNSLTWSDGYCAIIIVPPGKEVAGVWIQAFDQPPIVPQQYTPRRARGAAVFIRYDAVLGVFDQLSSSTQQAKIQGNFSLKIGSEKGDHSVRVALDSSRSPVYLSVISEHSSGAGGPVASALVGIVNLDVVASTEGAASDLLEANGLINEQQRKSILSYRVERDGVLKVAGEPLESARMGVAVEAVTHHCQAQQAQITVPDEGNFSPDEFLLLGSNAEQLIALFYKSGALGTIRATPNGCAFSPVAVPHGH